MANPLWRCCDVRLAAVALGTDGQAGARRGRRPGRAVMRSGARPRVNVGSGREGAGQDAAAVHLLQGLAFGWCLTCRVVVVAPQLQAALATKVLDVETKAVSSGGFKNRSTVGLMVKGTTVDNIVVGGPAFACKPLCKGDSVHKVNAPRNCHYTPVLGTQHMYVLLFEVALRWLRVLLVANRAGR